MRLKTDTTPFNFSEANLITLPTGLWWDYDCPGLGLRVTRPGLAFFIVHNSQGNLLMLGTLATMSLEAARRMAGKLQQQAAPPPVQPVAEAAKPASPEGNEITLRRAWADYQRFRALKPTTVRNYKLRLETNLAEWLDVPLADISRSMVLLKFAELSVHKTLANYTFKTLKAVFNFAAAFYETLDGKPIFTDNPVRKLTQIKAWHPEAVRRGCFASELGPWLRTVMSLDNGMQRDYWLLVLLTGMRKMEALSLRWEYVNLNSGIVLLPMTKNGYGREIPLSDFAWKLLVRRRYIAHPADKYVFQKPSGGHWLAIENSAQFIRQRSGVAFSCHDCRRTFASVADEIEIKAEVVAQLLGHRGNVTEDYTVRSIERLRRATQAITSYILNQAPNERQPAKEVPGYAISVI